MNIQNLIKARENELVYYSPYTFIRQIREAEQFASFVQPKLAEFGKFENKYQWSVIIEAVETIFLYEYLPWDSNHFNKPCFKLFTVLYENKNAEVLVQATRAYKEMLTSKGNFYCFTEIPSEDIFLFQCLNQAGFKMVETRLLYFKNDLVAFEGGKRFSVRKATACDIPILAQVAAVAKNNFDRLHADYEFTVQEADAYLATYATAAVNGFCDQVWVPHVQKLSVASFIAFNYLEKIHPELNVGIVYARLAAVAPENSGWFLKLLSEILYFGKEKKADYMKYTTQSVNKSVIRTLDSLGFRLGATSHVFAYHG